MRTCPDTGRSCFYLECAQGCEGYDIQVEQVSVTHTSATIKVRRSGVKVDGVVTKCSLLAAGAPEHGYQPRPSGPGAPNPPPKKP